MHRLLIILFIALVIFACDSEDISICAPGYCDESIVSFSDGLPPIELSIAGIVGVDELIALEECSFKVEFLNNSDEVVVYRFKWLDHPFDFPFPATLAGGELQPDEINQVEYKYDCGLYMVEWDFKGDDRDYVYAFYQEHSGKRTLRAINNAN